ncbi:uncharacterized protein C8R40DRAFT_114318 [Lentinula edodes]|uniref:uncharacterized protein n=1 Tax=Lentinula edodes TaxID=5353 RepID=UPI001E8DA756|nr:uncharacterized protein C8R40DRAFT_114318 [Lentinula edodes]KAH7876734.1 hypothetical protein C8R40DRAFT_114318 [Lentinula edodes]
MQMSARDKSNLLNSALRPQRKPKVPKDALGARAKASLKQQSSRKSSPLPPSSPFATSSQIPDFLPIATSEASEHLETPFYEEVSVEEEHDFESDVYGMLEEPADVQYSTYSARNSDPFGFFALEAKLKAQRKEQSITTTSNAPYPQSWEPPHSPHKPRIRKRASGKNADSPSLPSSPSPAKPRRVTKQGLAKATNTDETKIQKALSDDEKDCLDVASQDYQPRKRMKTKAVRRQGQRNGDKSVDPERLARDLKVLLPKRSSRRNGKRRSDSNSHEADAKRLRGTTRDKQNKSDTGDQERDSERQKRLEYFKKLEDYKVAKENVYVI